MNKQLMLEIVQFATIMLVAIIISGFNPSFLMLVCMQLSACERYYYSFLTVLSFFSFFPTYVNF